jgi:[ribosomal protein S5]-alanine N-acetyltransferase
MPYLETARLCLQPFTSAGLAFLHSLWLDPQVRRYLWDDQLISREQVREVIESSLACFAAADYGFWLVRLKEDGKPIGFCGLRQFNDAQVGETQVEILYGVAPEYWSNGYAVEAAHAVLRFGFERLQLACIYAGADPPNVASFRVMEKLGMQLDHRTQLQGREAIYYAITCEGFYTIEHEFNKQKRP